MSHSLCRIWVHLVYGTKHHAPLITPALKPLLYARKHDELIKLRCRQSLINGTADHVHVLTRLDAGCAPMRLLKQLKGAVSRWVNEEGLSEDYFDWQTGYAAFSVSENAVERVYRYIARQEEHHRRRGWAEEYEEYLRLKLWTPDDGYADDGELSSVVREEELPW